jgi:TolB-like protein/cytochrome c-type biogenesis protein CcmH/NrfG
MQYRLAVDFLSGIVRWIASNETFLSGLAAIVAVAGVVFTPMALAFRQRRRSASSPPPPASPPVAPSAAEISDRPSLAVLPFLNLSDDTEQEYLADGMTEDLITGLAANRHLSVVSRNSSFAYKGKSPDIREVGRELGVRYVLEGSVRRVGERMRTTAQLIESSSGEHLWAEKYDRPYAEMFEVQDEVVGAIAGALNAQLSAAEYARARRETPEAMGAWERVQKALWDIFYGMTPDRVRSGVEALREAVTLDPEYAYAHSALAWTLLIALINGYAEDIPGTATEARSHLRAAMEGGNDDPLTLFYAGAAYVYSGQFASAIETLERSLARNPHQPDVHMHLGMARSYQERFDEAHAHFDRAEALAPSGGMSLAYGWYRTFTFGFEERQAEAVSLLESLLPRMPGYASPRIMLGLYLDEIGRSEEGRKQVERAVQETPSLNREGVSLLVGSHPDPAKGAARLARLHEFWPAA